MSVLERALGTFTGGAGSGQPLALDRPPWIRQSRLLDASRVSSPERALTIGTVFACIRLISQAVASVPLLAYQQPHSGPRVKARESDLWTLVHDRAHPRLPASLLWQVVAAHLAGWGQAFVLKTRERKRIVSLWPLYPSRVKVCEENGEVFYDYQLPEGSTVRLTPREVLHIRHFSIDGVTGVSPIELARRDLSAIDQESTFRDALLANGARLSGVLTTPGTLSQEASERVAKQWSDAHSGADRAGSVAVMEGGMTWLPMSAAPKDLEFVAQRQASVADIGRWFGIPPSLINAASQHPLRYTTTESESLGLVKWCVVPGYLGPIETAVNNDQDLAPRGSGLMSEFLTDGRAPSARPRRRLRGRVLRPRRVRRGRQPRLVRQRPALLDARDQGVLEPQHPVRPRHVRESHARLGHGHPRPRLPRRAARNNVRTRPVDRR